MTPPPEMAMTLALDDFSFGETLSSSFVGFQEFLEAVFILLGFGSGYRRILLVGRRFLLGKILSRRMRFVDIY